MCIRCEEKEMLKSSESRCHWDYYPEKNEFKAGDTIYFKLTIPKEIRASRYNVYRCEIIDTTEKKEGYVSLYMHREYTDLFTYGKRYDIKGFYKGGNNNEYVFKEEGNNYVYECANVLELKNKFMVLSRFYMFLRGINNRCNEDIFLDFARPIGYGKYDFDDLYVYVRDTVEWRPWNDL